MGSLFQWVSNLINGKPEKPQENKDTVQPTVEMEHKEEAKVEVKTDEPVVVKTEAEVEAKSEIKAEAKPEVKAEVKTAPQAEVAPQTNIVPQGVVGDDFVDKKENLIAGVIKTLATNNQGKVSNFTDKVLKLWVLDNLFGVSLSDNLKEFTDELMRKIDDELGYTFAYMDVNMSRLPDEETFTEVMPSVYLQIKAIERASVVKKARITAIAGTGTLLQPSYELSSVAIAQLPQKRYNIGSGERPQMEGCGFRENQIVIDDNPDNPLFGRNKYVSRSHAYITYRENEGFLLFVEFNGTRIAGKRTHISRADRIIEMNNIKVPELLHDGDIIELSKSVKLLFQTVEE